MVATAQDGQPENMRWIGVVTLKHLRDRGIS